MCQACEDEAERHVAAMDRITVVREADAMDCDDAYDEVDDETETEPYLIGTQAEIDGYPPFPFPVMTPNNVDYGCDGWETVRTLFCDSSGFGRPGEPALTIKQLKAELRPEFAYAITGIGQFQVYITEYKRVEP